VPKPEPDPEPAPPSEFAAAYDWGIEQCRQICCEQDLGVESCDVEVKETKDGEVEAFAFPKCGGEPIFCPQGDESIKLPDTWPW
jgi:hypothetical protein